MSSTTSPTPPPDPLPTQLLYYLPSHKALICNTCQYAIQPTAISRHLKDIHAIHRARRRPFMAYVSTLGLASPEQVIETQTEVGIFPVPGLPVVEGLMCKYEDCGHLCVSTKRMRSHWLASHGVQARVGLDWKAVGLQTFFRGNLLKYFSDGVVHGGTAKAVVDAGVDDEMVYEYNTLILEDITPPRATSPSLDTSDAALLQHFITSTACTLSINPATNLIWETAIPSMAKSHLFLYHGILSCSALHLAHLHSSSPINSQLRLLASQHQEIAMPLFRETMTSVTPSNCDAVLAFAHLLIIISFANDTQSHTQSQSPRSTPSQIQTSQRTSNNNEELLLVSPPAPPMPITTIYGSTNAQEGDSIIPPWLYLLRAGCSILCDIWDYLELGPVSALAGQWDVPVQVPDGTPPPLLPYLLSLIPSSSTNPFSIPSQDSASAASRSKTWTEHEISTYIDSARSLDLAFRYRVILGGEFTTWDALRVWPIALSQDYLDLLARRHEGALVLLGFYCVLLKMVEIRWYFGNRAQRLLRAVLACLDAREDGEKWRKALCWAIMEVGIDESEPPKTDMEWKGGDIWSCNS